MIDYDTSLYRRTLGTEGVLKPTVVKSRFGSSLWFVVLSDGRDVAPSYEQAL